MPREPLFITVLSIDWSIAALFEEPPIIPACVKVPVGNGNKTDVVCVI